VLSDNFENINLLQDNNHFGAW